jgi:hypothetical protein
MQPIGGNRTDMRVVVYKPRTGGALPGSLNLPGARAPPSFSVDFSDRYWPILAAPRGKIGHFQTPYLALE